MDKIIIRNLLTRGCIGISEAERSAQQDILVNAVLYTDTAKAARSDSIEDCVNYSTMAKKIVKMAAENRRKTVEAFAEDFLMAGIVDGSAQNRLGSRYGTGVLCPHFGYRVVVGLELAYLIVNHRIYTVAHSITVIISGLDVQVV